MVTFVQTLILGVLVGGVYALLASGLTLIFGVMNVINIAQGAFVILAALTTYTLWTAIGVDPLAAIVVTTPMLFAFGWVLYTLTLRHVRGAPAAATVLLTFGIALVVEGLMGLIWGNTAHAVRPGYVNDSFHLGSLFLPKAQVYGGVIALGVLAVLWVVLTKTWLGRAIRAAAINPAGAALVGVNVAAVSAMTFAVGVASAGAGGSIASVLFTILPGSHYVWISRLLAIIVLGGMGSLPGALLGALLLGITETMTVAYISPAWATAVPYALVLVVLLVRPHGILGSRLRADVVT